MEIENFKRELEIIRSHGFNPIGVSSLACVETFIFETEEEANHAHELLEVEKELIRAWWYSREGFQEALKWVEEMYNGKYKPTYLFF
jgi:hypothetical protein